MADCELIRVDNKPDGEGTFGVWKVDGEAYCVTLEPETPVIPAGRWRCVRTTYHAGGYETFEVTGIPGHTRVLIHKGNTDDDTRGCVLLASYFGKLKGARAILNSGITFEEWMERMAGIPEFMLTVYDVPHFERTI